MRGFSKFQCELISQLGLHKKEGNLETSDLPKITAGSSECLSCYLDQQNLRQILPLQDFSFSSLLLYWLWSFSFCSCYSPIVEAESRNPQLQLCREVLQCCWRSASWRPGKQRGASIQKCFANLEMCLNFPSFISQSFLSPEVWQAVLTRPSFLCTQHIPTLKILLKRKNLHIIKCLGKWLLLNTLEAAIHSATIQNNITCCTASEIIELFLLHRGSNEK